MDILTKHRGKVLYFTINMLMENFSVDTLYQFKKVPSSSNLLKCLWYILLNAVSASVEAVCFPPFILLMLWVTLMFKGITNLAFLERNQFGCDIVQKGADITGLRLLSLQVLLVRLAFGWCLWTYISERFPLIQNVSLCPNCLCKLCGLCWIPASFWKSGFLIHASNS